MPMTEPTQAVLQNLPNELFVNHIATTLDARSIAALSKTCRRFRALFKAERLYLREAHYFCPNDTSAYEFSEKIKKSIQAIKIGHLETGKTLTDYLFDAIVTDDVIGTIASIKSGANITTPRKMPNGGGANDVLTMGHITPLFLAAYYGQAGALEVLLKLGKVDPNQTNAYSKLTALFAAVASGSVQCVKKLIDYDADVYHRAADLRNITPLQYAVQRNQDNIAEVLLDAHRKKQNGALHPGR